jgi:hypothetical protein
MPADDVELLPGPGAARANSNHERMTGSGETLAER